jgi:hypothetical protein
VWWFLGGSSRVVAVNPGARLLGVSRGTLTWHGRTCSVWQTQLDGAHAAEPLEPLLYLAECPPDDPRFEGEVVYHLSGQGRVTRNVPGRRRVLLQRTLAYALALDGRYLYVGNCAQRDNCQIERLPAEDDPGDPLLMQAGILALANMEVDQKELFWIDRGRRKPDCHRDIGEGLEVGGTGCADPVPPRLMAASKAEPRATERVVVNDFDGRRPLLGAGHVYWMGADGVHRVAKTGGPHRLLFPARTLSGFAADGDEVFFASDAGIFRARDGDGDARLFQRTSSPPRGVAVDAGHVYWIDGDDNAVVRRRR